MASWFHYPAWLTRTGFNAPSPAAPELGAVEAVREAFAAWPKGEPYASILLVARNEEQYLFRTLQSLAALGQHWPWTLELVFVDNGSSDATTAIAEACGLVVHREERVGGAYARQMALEKAKGRFILSVDADTVYPPTWGLNMVEALEEQPDLACAYGMYRFLAEGNYSLWGLSLYRFLGDPVQSFRAVRREFINVLGCNMAFRRLDALRLGGFIPMDAEKPIPEGDHGDGRLVLRLSVFGRLQPWDDPTSTAWTSPRGLGQRGGLLRVTMRRLGREARRYWPKRRTIVIE